MIGSSQKTGVHIMYLVWYRKTLPNGDSQWGEGNLRYGGARGFMIAALYCIEHAYNDSISFFNIFGSHLTDLILTGL